MLKGFREFIARGNVIDLATAVIIGAAFTAVVTAFTIVGFAAPGIEVPFVAAILDCGGTSPHATCWA